MRIAALALLVLALAACGGDGEEDAAPATTAAGTTGEAAPETAAPEETTAAPAEETTTAPEAESEGPPFERQPASGAGTGPTEGSAMSLLADVRLERQDGFDRLVFEFREGGVPGHRIAWVRPPIQTNPGGATMSVTGEAFLAIRLEPASGFDTGAGEPTEVYQGPLRLVGDAVGAQIVRDVVRTEDFQQVTTWVAGLARRAPFRAFALEGPPRIVVDVSSG